MSATYHVPIGPNRPVFVLQYPLCSECDRELNTDSDAWWCEDCGSTWPYTATDGDEASHD